MKIFIIGFMGSGKSYWLNLLKPHTNSLCIDLDEYIESKEGKNIATIFEVDGEDNFRQKEAFYLNQLIEQHTNLIVACGGGTPCFYDNLNVMKQAGKVIYLKINDLKKHPYLKPNDKLRPLTQTENFIDHMNSLLNTRKHYYEQADVVINLDELNKTNFIQKLLIHE